MEIVMFIGIPATGKSSFYQERFAASHLRINRDMLKTAPRTSSLFEWCIQRKQSCVIDNTNTTRAVRSGWISSAKEKDVPVIGYFFESKLEEALVRNSQREGAARIRDAGVRYHHDQLVPPSLDEGFSSLFFCKACGRWIQSGTMKQVIMVDNEILGGEPVFVDTRVPVRSLFDHLEGGESIEDFLAGFPAVKREQVIAVLEESKAHALEAV